MLSVPVTYKCPQCGFGLWNPVGSLEVSTLGLYNDGRFPGRSILVLNEHIEHWEDVPSELLSAYVADSQHAIRAIAQVTGASRVNLAVLGNTDAHVHFHLIPRYPDAEAFPGKSPWNDPRPSQKLGELELERLVHALAAQMAIG